MALPDENNTTIVASFETSALDSLKMETVSSATSQSTPRAERSMMIRQLPRAVDWLRWAETLPLTDISKEVFVPLKTHFHQLIDDLTQLSSKWDTQLTVRPSIIWSDVLAFAVSKYLPEAHSVYQVPIDWQTRESTNGASRRLCHISATSPDGSILGILSIWPSRKFEMFWENVDPHTAYTKVEDYCEDWHATYELSRVGEQVEKLGTVSILLQPTEVALQMRQAFRQEDLTTWKASFPFSISFDGYSVCVLRTIYHVTIEETSSKLLVQSCRMPLDSIAGIEKFWEHGLTAHDPSYALSIGLPASLQLLQRQLYTYRTIFDVNSRYIFFQDAKKFEAPLLAVFKIEYSNSERLTVQLVAVAPEESGVSWLGSTGLPLATAKFHPESPLIVSAIKGRVMAWDFSTNIMNHLSRGGADVTNLSISACANYVVVMRQNCGSYEVHDLRQCDIAPFNNGRSNVGVTALLLPTEKKTIHDTHEGYMARLDSGTEIATRYGSASAVAAVSGNTTIVPARIQDIGCQLRIDSGRVKLAVPPSAGEENSKSLDLLSIPNAIASHDSRITVYLPREDEKHLSILMNKGIEDGYNMVQESEESLPVLVRKDRRLIHEAIQEAVGGGGEGIRLVEGTKRKASEIDE